MERLSYPRSIFFSTIGRSIARDFDDKAASTRSSSDRRKILKEGLYDIVFNSGTTVEEKKVAQFGIDIGAINNTSDEDAAKARALVMSALSVGITAPVGAAIVKISLDAVQAVSSPEVKINILKQAFINILVDREMPGEIKSLAKKGYDVGAGGVSDEQLVNARLTIMMEILEKTVLKKERIEQEFKEMAEAASREPVDSTQILDDFVIIDGVRLPVKEAS